MWAFQYKHGDRPLEGYTIQRAAGRGGFGEVYYAISDSGREVALKVVQGYEQIELRGISQCMNLKSPHLVTIFDVKYNAENKPFVIMEFVSGPNLRQILDESPAGVGTQKAAFFLREIAKGLSFLHDCGIVHRDLKPANIFYENGYVKIGDYGLSKAIATSQHSGQTVTVGTVHYMAPEIGAGKYDRGIDIYALGAVLYEMLTGTPPFLGASPSEVLMKHLAAEPDVTGIPQPFATVIKKAMAKDPATRYQHVQQMVEDVFGAEHVRQSVSVFSPEDLSIVAERVAKKATATVGGGGSSSPAANAGARQQARPDVWQRLGSAFDQVGNAAAAGRIAGFENAAGAAPVADPLLSRHRWMLAGLVSLVACIAGTVVSMRAMGPPIVSMLFIFLCAWGAALGALVAARTLLPRMQSESAFMQRAVVGMMASFVALVFSLPTWAATAQLSTGATLLAILAPLFFMDTRKWIAPDRAERVQLGKIIAAGFIGFIVAAMLNANTNLVIASLAGTAMLVQILSPWDPVAGAVTQAREEAGEEDDDDEDDEDEGERIDQKFKAKAAAISEKFSGLAGAATSSAVQSESGPSRYWYRPVWRFARMAWLAGVVVFLTLGVVFCVAGGMEHNPTDVGPLVAAGISSLMLFVLSLLQSFRTRFYGWWGYLIKPVVLTMCLMAIASAAIVMGNMPHGLMAQDEAIIGTFWIVFPAVTFVVLLFVSGKSRANSALVSSASVPVMAPVTPATPPVPSPQLDLEALKRSNEKKIRALHRRAVRDLPTWRAARRQERHPFSALLGGVAGILIFASVAIGLGLAFDLPGMIAAGVPDSKLGNELQNHVFHGVTDWPKLLTKIATATAMLLMVVGICVLLWARRHGGVLHMIRGVIGSAGLLFAVTPLAEAFRANATWQTIGALVGKKEIGTATEVFFDQIQSGAAIGSAAMLITFLILLAWPAPRERSVTPRAVRGTATPAATPAPAPAEKTKELEHA